LAQEYALADTPEEAAQLVAEDPEAIVMGGGTTLMPRATIGGLSGRRVIGLARAGLDYVHRNGATTLGAMTPLRVVADLPEAPLLASAARSVGSWALRTTATVGGNLLVRGPYGDLAPALLALDARIAVAGANGARTLALAEAIEGGAAVGAGELLTEVIVPPTEGAASFQRCARVASGAPPIVTVAARVRREGGAIAEARVAIGAVGPRAVRATEAEERLVGSPGDATALDEAVAAAARVVEAGDDSVASAWYRARMTELYVRRALAAALGEGEG
jgi:CO/xanthine dehydrogenase FAD-binding subunit